VIQKFFHFILNCLGWKITGALPQINKYVLIAAPHTSNWDLVIGLIARFSQKGSFYFLAKHQVFFFPLGSILKALGGIPVHRSKPHDLVESITMMFKERENFILGLAPEGTRSPVKRWKTGFYHIAYRAKVPIVMVGFDYSKKEFIIREPFWPTGAIEEDFKHIIEFYRGIKGRYLKEIPDFDG